jgi:FSR family fosmidomycin resistance protein-like MFS transporter
MSVPGPPPERIGIEVKRAVLDSPVYSLLLAISFCHLLNDMVQSMLSAYYPVLKSSFHLTFAQVGLITLTYQITASLLQPLVGLYTDYRPQPYSLPVGMGVTLFGLLSWSVAHTFPALLMSAALVGVGSAVFHPESSRVARLASGGQHGLAQSIFQVGGNAGASLGPLIAAFVIVPKGQHSIAYFSLSTLLALAMLVLVGGWHRTRGPVHSKSQRALARDGGVLPRSKVILSLTVLLVLIFSKYVYLSSLTVFYTFFLMHKFHLSVQSAQVHLFIFLGSAAVGTFAGGPIGDRIGRKYVIWGSILGVLPFSLALPYANMFWTTVLTVIIGLALASAFASILVFAQELVPGKLGMISGLFFGFAFGISGIGAAVLGKVADLTSIDFVYHVVSFLPALGILTALLPDMEPVKRTPTLR